MSRLRESTMKVRRRKTDQHKMRPMNKSQSTAIIRSRSLEPMQIETQSPFDYYYNEKECYKGFSKPVGFLDLIDVSVEQRQTIHHLCDQYTLLHSIFCEFPVNMLKILFIRENGNARMIAKNLIDKGWKPHDEFLIKSLSTITLDLLSVKYYWGELTQEYKKTLESSPVGTFFSAYNSNTNEFVICFVNHKHKVLETRSDHPNVTPNHYLIFSLKKPLSRPSCIPIMNLAPFLQD